MIIGRVKEDFKEYCKKIDEKKKIALPMSAFKPKDWKKIGKRIFDNKE